MAKVATISEANASLYIYICIYIVICARMVGELDLTKKKIKRHYTLKKEEQEGFMYKHGDDILKAVTVKKI